MGASQGGAFAPSSILRSPPSSIPRAPEEGVQDRHFLNAPLVLATACAQPFYRLEAQILLHALLAQPLLPAPLVPRLLSSPLYLDPSRPTATLQMLSEENGTQADSAVPHSQPCLAASALAHPLRLLCAHCLP